MKTFDGYKKRALTDEYALLAGGGHKPLSDFSTSAHTHSIKINGVTKTIAASGGAAVDLGSYLQSILVTTALNNITWALTASNTYKRAFIYNTSGAEYSYLFGLKNDGKYGAILKMGYTDRYLRILRVNNGNWQSTDWEKISAGYADTAGAIAWANVTGKPSTFAPSSHNHPTSQINALTSYTKATSAAALATTDSLNTALGKLEYKLDVAYNLVTKANDSDGTIENLKEILDVLTGIKDTETIKALVGKYLPLAGGTMTLGEGLKFHADDNYFGTNLDARIISLLDGNGATCDGGLIIDERATYNGTTTVTELLRIRDNEFKWKGSNIWHAGNLTKVSQLTNDKGYVTSSGITSITLKAGAGISLDTDNTAITSTGTRIITNSGVRSTTINGNYLRVNTNGTNADLTIPYAITASLLNNISVSDPNTAASGLNVKWYSQISQSSGYAGTNYGFPVSNNANGILWLGTHSGPYGWQMGFSSNGHIYARYISNNSFSTSANGGSWNRIAWTSDIPTSLKNPYTLTLQAGTFATKTYDGSAAVTVNIPTHTSHLVNNSGFLTSHLSLANYVTLNTAQTITGAKTFSNNLTLSADDEDRYITFIYTGSTGYDWRIGYLGSGSGDANYFVILSNKTNGTYVNALRIGLTTLASVFGGTVTSSGFVKSNSSNSYVLLGGGGHKLISDFATSGHTHSYLPLSGGTMSGALNFKNGTWNLMGDDAYIGDCNVAGMIGVKGANAATPGFALYNNSGTLLGKLYASGGTLNWSGGTIAATTFSGNASSATKLTSSAGSATLPIYFSDGKPVACTASSIFSNLSNSGNNISLTVAGQNRTLTVGYADNAEAANYLKGYTKIITVNGDINTYYPVKIPNSSRKSLINTISVWRDLGLKSAIYPGSHGSYTTGNGGGVSCWYEFVGRYNGWDGNGGYYYTRRAWYAYDRQLSHAAAPGNAVGDLFVWLRGGGTKYYVSTNYPFSDPVVYYERTNASGSSQYLSWVEPRTDIGNEGILTNTYYGNIIGNANTASGLSVTHYWANVAISTSSKTNTTPTFGKVTISGAYPQIQLNSTNSESSIYYLSSDGTGWATGPRAWGVNGFGIGVYTSTNNGVKLTILDNGNVGIGTTSPSYKLHVAGDSYSTGWSRAGAGFYCEDTGVHYTHLGSVGEIDLTSNNEFLWGSSTSTLYFNYRTVSRGTTVSNYIWNAGSSTSYASHTLGTLTSRGDLTLYGLTQTCNKANNSSYMHSALLIREYNFGGSQSDTWAIAPRLSWHWSGRVLAQIGLGSNNHLYISEDNFSNAYRIVMETGTWGINISGNASTATNADKLDGYHATCGTNKPWGTIPVIGTDGVIELGRYIDLHYDNTTGSDYSTRLQVSGNNSNVINLPSASGTLALTSQIPTVTNYYWANIKVSASSSTTTTPAVASLSITGDANTRGIQFPGGAWLNSIGKQVILRDGNLRFGGSGWDWNQWAGLKYDYTTKKLYLGIPDGTIFNANSAVTGGYIGFPGIAMYNLGREAKVDADFNAHYGTTASPGGWFKIKINPETSWMLSFTIRLYQSYASADILIQGYNYGGNYWYSPNALIIGGTYTSIAVKFGYDKAYGLWVAVPAASYTGISILGANNGYTQTDWYNGFTITNVAEASLTTVLTTITAYRPWYRNETVSNATNATYADYAYRLRINSANSWSNWYWSGQSGQPTWLWGSNDGTNMYVWNPSNFSVNYANSAGNADTVDGQHFNWSNNRDDHSYLWAASSNGQAYLVHRASMSVNYANYSGYAQKLLVHDVRSATRTPNYFDGKRVTAWFNNTGTPDGDWWSGIHVKGWDNGYASWELCSYSSTGTGNDYNLYFRNGNNTSWGNWKTILTSSNYTSYINTTNFPGLSKTGTVTSITVTGSNGLSGSGTITTSGTITLSNSGVRSTTINGNYLRVNTNGTNTDLTIPYATNADKLDGYHASSFALSGHTHSNYLPLSGGTMNNNARISHNGNLYIGRSDNGGWVLCLDMCSLSSTGDTYWSLRTSGTLKVKFVYLDIIYPKTSAVKILGLMAVGDNSFSAKTGYWLSSQSIYVGNENKTEFFDLSGDGIHVIHPLPHIDFYKGKSSVDGNYTLRLIENTEGRLTLDSATTTPSLLLAGNIYASGYYESSDITLKTNFSKISTTIEQISDLPVFDFSWKENLSSRNTGTSAQAVQTILPNIVTESSGSLKLNYGVLGTIAGIIACKELVIQKSEIEQLRERVIELEKQLNEYRSIYKD